MVRAFEQLDSPVELRSISKHRLGGEIWRDDVIQEWLIPAIASNSPQPEPPLLTGIRVVASSVSDRYLRSWYLQRVTELSACGQTSSGEADWEAAKYANNPGATNELGVPLGILDDDPGVHPIEHVFVSEKAPWFEITDALPQHQKVPVGA